MRYQRTIRRYGSHCMVRSPGPAQSHRGIRQALLLGALVIVLTSACDPASAVGSRPTSGLPRGGILTVAMPTWNGSELLFPTLRSDALDPQAGTWLDTAELFR
jgi:hypothetical protein